MNAAPVNASIETITQALKQPAGPSWHKNRLLGDTRKLFRQYEKGEITITPDNIEAFFNFLTAYIEFTLLNTGLDGGTRKEIRSNCETAAELLKDTEYLSRIHSLKGKFHQTVVFQCITSHTYNPEALLEPKQREIWSLQVKSAKDSYTKALSIDNANQEAATGLAEINTTGQLAAEGKMGQLVAAVETHLPSKLQRTLPDGRKLMPDNEFSKQMLALLRRVKHDNPEKAYRTYRLVGARAENHGPHVKE